MKASERVLDLVLIKNIVISPVEVTVNISDY